MKQARLLWLCLALPLARQAWCCAGLAVDAARIPEGPPEAEVLAGYAVLRNAGTADLSLSGADSPDFRQVEFHSVAEEGGRMRMRAEPGLTVPAHGRLYFAPGKLHIMLFGPKRGLRAGESTLIGLRCGASRLDVEFKVEAR